MKSNVRDEHSWQNILPDFPGAAIANSGLKLCYIILAWFLLSANFPLMDELDAHPSGMPETDDEPTSGSKLPLLALLVGLIGIVFGVAGIFMAAQSGKKLDRYIQEMSAKPDTSTEQIAAMKSEIASQQKSIDERLANIGTSVVRNQRSITETRGETQKAFDSVSKEVTSNRTQLNETAEKLSELLERVASGAAPAPSRATVKRTQSSSDSGADVSSSGGSDGTSSVSSGTIHKVASGDTMSSIAKYYSVSLTALMEANPSVNPRKMQVGQEIVIP